MTRNILLKKTPITIIALFLFALINAQQTEKFFDFRWRECKPNVARYYSLVVKTDSGYCRKNFYLRERKLQMLGNYKDSLLQIETGKFYYFHANGSPECGGKYVNGQKEGLWLGYYRNKMLNDSTTFLHDKQIGTSLKWYQNGIMSDSVYTNEDGSGVSKSWFDNGTISSIGKYSAGNNLDGLWKFYHYNGKVSSLETYQNSKLVDKQYFDEEGIQMNDTTNNDREARYTNKEGDWLNYIGRKVAFPFNQQIINGDTARVVVSFTINEDGMVENAYTSTPFSPKFDRELENAIIESPQWYAAIKHNRKVKTEHIQSIVFVN